MGVDVTVLDFLLKFRGKIHGQVLQLGRQALHIPQDPKSRIFAAAETVFKKCDTSTPFVDLFSSTGYTEALFSYLGAGQLQSIDASRYERADLVHDLNIPVGDDLKERFHVIFDGGTVEHIFDIRMVFENVTRMLKSDGLFLSVNGANNWLGHGFYQFSPELCGARSREAPDMTCNSSSWLKSA